MSEEKRKKFRKVPAEVPVSSLDPLNITCGTTKCDANLHCFSLKKSSINNFGKPGVCRDCGADLIDWQRVHTHDLKDVSFLFNSLKNELIRHVFWHTEIKKEAVEGTKNDDRQQIKDRAKKILKSRVGKLNSFMDGRQTPMGGKEIINYAQHATATCCRKCMEIWHDIPPENELTEEQLDFLSELNVLYVEDRIGKLKQ